MTSKHDDPQSAPKPDQPRPEHSKTIGPGLEEGPKKDVPDPNPTEPPRILTAEAEDAKDAQGKPETENRELTKSSTIRSPTMAEAKAMGAPGITISGKHQKAPEDVVQPGGNPGQISGQPIPGKAARNDHSAPKGPHELPPQSIGRSAADTGQEPATIAGTEYTEESVKAPAEKERNEIWQKAEERDKAAADKREKEDAHAKTAASHSNPADEHANERADHGAGHGNRPGQSGGSHGASNHATHETQGGAKKR
jgi:hypothetical protein